DRHLMHSRRCIRMLLYQRSIPRRSTTAGRLTTTTSCLFQGCTGTTERLLSPLIILYTIITCQPFAFHIDRYCICLPLMVVFYPGLCSEGRMELNNGFSPALELRFRKNAQHAENSFSFDHPLFLIYRLNSKLIRLTQYCLAL